MDETQGQAQETTQEDTGAQKTGETTPDIDSWEKDKRFESSWKKDPNRLYKSYRDMEKVYPPLAQVLSKFGYKSPDELKKALEEYKSYQDPENDVNKLIAYLKPILGNEKYLREFSSQVDKYRKQIDRENFGSHLTDEEVQALKESQTLKEKIEKMEFDRDVEKTEVEMEKSLSSITAYAKEHGLEFNRDDFIKYCYDRNVPPHLMQDVFEAKAKPLVAEQDARKREELTAQNKAKNNSGVIPSGTKTQGEGGKGNWVQQLDAILTR